MSVRQIEFQQPSERRGGGGRVRRERPPREDFASSRPREALSLFDFLPAHAQPPTGEAEEQEEEEEEEEEEGLIFCAFRRRRLFLFFFQPALLFFAARLLFLLSLPRSVGRSLFRSRRRRRRRLLLLRSSFFPFLLAVARLSKRGLVAAID